MGLHPRESPTLRWPVGSSRKTHLKRVTTNVKLTYKELSTVLTQIEACLNRRPLTRMYCNDDGVEALTPGHFLIGRPIEALPDASDTDQPLTLLKRWHLCQTILNHFWKRWSGEYISSLQRYAKWKKSTRNIKIGDVVIIREDGLLPTKWAIARVVDIHPGQDNAVRVVTIRTSTSTYKRPVTKVAVLIPIEQHMYCIQLHLFLVNHLRLIFVRPLVLAGGICWTLICIQTLFYPCTFL